MAAIKAANCGYKNCSYYIIDIIATNEIAVNMTNETPIYSNIYMYIYISLYIYNKLGY